MNFRHKKTRFRRVDLIKHVISVVAGAGFEPTTFAG
jgi:hypothetical protein